MATGMDFLNSYMRRNDNGVWGGNDDTKETKEEKDNYPYVYTPKEKDIFETPWSQDLTETEGKAKTETDNYPYVYAQEEPKTDAPGDGAEVTEETTEQPKHTKAWAEAAVIPEVKFDNTGYSRRPIYNIKDGAIDGIKGYAYTKDEGKTYYNNKGEKLDFTTYGDKADAPALTPQQEIPMLVSNAYRKLGNGLADMPEDEARKKLWDTIQGTMGEIDFSHYKEGGKLKSDLKDAVWEMYKQTATDYRLKEAENEQKRIDEAMRKRMEEIDGRPGQKFHDFMARAAASSASAGLLAEQYARDSKYLDDPIYMQLESAARKNRKTIQLLKDKVEGRTNEFWHTLGSTLMDGYSLSDGMGDMRDAEAQRIALKHADAIAKKQAEGKPLTADEQVAETVLRNSANEYLTEAELGNQYGALARAANTTATSAGMMKDIMLFPNAGGLAKDLATGITNRMLLGVVKTAGWKAAGNLWAHTVPRVIMKATGMFAGSHLIGGLVSNTTGIGNTMGVIAKEHSGHIVQDKQGKYTAYEAKDLASAFLEGERTQMRENGSEMFGEFIPSATKIAKKIGLSKIADGLEDMAKPDWLKQYSSILKASGFHGLGGEIAEEYEGSAFDVATGHWRDAWEEMKDPQTHIDIVLGCAATAGLLGALPGGVQTYRTARYYQYKHAVNKADRLASLNLGSDKWIPIRDHIDETDNKAFSNVVYNVLQTQCVNATEKNLILDYARNLTKMRGYNIADIQASNEAKPEEVKPEEQTASDNYSDGYQTTDPKAMNEAKERYDAQKVKLAQQLGCDVEDVDEKVGNGLAYVDEQRKSGDTESLQTAIEYANAKAAYEGMVQRVRDDIDDRVAESDATIDQRTNQDDGKVHTASLKTLNENNTNKQVFIISGNIATFDDGKIDKQNSDATVVVRDAATGELQMLSPDDICTVDTITDAEQEKATAADAIRTEMAQAAADNIDGKNNDTTEQEIEQTPREQTEQTPTETAPNDEANAEQSAENQTVPTDAGENVRVREALEKGKLLYLKGGGAQTEQNQPSVSGATSEEVNAGSSLGKGTTSGTDLQENGVKSSGNEQKKGEAKAETTVDKNGESVNDRDYKHDKDAQGGGENAPMTTGNVVSSQERAEMENRITDWLSEENLERAVGKTREEIFEEFGNELAPIAYIPAKHLAFLGDDVKDPRIYCGKGYFIDHALRNHGGQGTQIDIDDVDVSKYLNIQYVLDNPDHIKETFTDGKRTVVFIKKIGRYFAELTQVKEDGKIVLHKSLFNQKKEPYAKLVDIRQKGASSEGGVSSISHADNAAPAISLESRGDAFSSEPGTTGISENKGTDNGTDLQENGVKSSGNEQKNGKKSAKQIGGKVEIDYDAALSRPSGLRIGRSGKTAVDAFKFTEHDKERLGEHPALGGVHYENGVAVASDGHVLVAVSTDYSEEYEGKTVNKSGEAVEGNFPKWKTFMPTTGESVDKDAFLHAVGEAEAAVGEMKKLVKEYKEQKKTDKDAKPSDEQAQALDIMDTGNVYIAVPSSHGDVMIRYDAAMKVADVMRKAQNTEVLVGMPKYGGGMLVATGDGVVSMAMPVLVDESLTQGKFFHVGEETDKDIRHAFKDMNEESDNSRQPMAEPSRQRGELSDSDAKVDNRIELPNDYSEKLSVLSERIENGEVIAPTDFLLAIEKTLGSSNSNADKSQYFKGKENTTLRLANHRGNARMFLVHDHVTGNTSIVVKMSDKKGKKNDKVDLKEFVYFPDKMTADVQRNIIEGLRKWGETGEYNQPCDQISVSTVNNSIREQRASYVSSSERLAGSIENNRVGNNNTVDFIIGKKMRKAIERLGKTMGVNVEYLFTDEENNGWYDPKTNTVYVTLDASMTEGVQFIFGHEMTHEIKTKNPKAYEELLNLVKNELGEDYESQVDDMTTRYSLAGLSGYGRGYYEEEVVADHIGTWLQDADYVHTLAMRMSHPLLARLHDVVDRMKTALVGTEYENNAKNVLDAIEQAYVQTKDKDKVESVDEEVRYMGSRTNKRMKEIGKYFENKELSDEGQTVVDVFNGSKKRATVLFTNNDGIERHMEFAQGSEPNAGARHAIMRHYENGNSAFNADDILNINTTLEQGERTEEGDKVVYTYNHNNGVEYTIVSEKDKGKENFVTFYTNRKAPDSGVSYTQQSAHANLSDAHSSAKVGNATETAKENGVKFSLRDAEYMKAVEDGDMEKAQRMVNEAAEAAGYSTGSDYQGTSAFNGAAPWGNGYFLTREERKEAWDNGEFEGESTLGDYISDDIDGGNLEELTNAASYRAADPMRKEAIDNVRNAIQKKSKTITMYRSVPAGVKEGSFRNGDWITPSRAYAVDNAKLHGWGDNYNVIEQEVPVDDVWFDGNDIAEWGYGREEDYVNDTDFAYKNTENNRKSLDAVTYDDNGYVIPLSKRFNSRKADVRYSLKDNDAANEFHSVVDQMFDDANFDNSKHRRERYNLGKTPDWMKKVGIKGDDFSLSFKNIKTHKGKDSDHDLTRDEWHELPNALMKPFAVTRYKGAEDRFRLYVNIYHNDRPVAVGVDVKHVNQGKDKPQLDVNSIKTVFAHRGTIGDSEVLVAYDKEITPEQEALLRGLNFHEYPTIQELSSAKVGNTTETAKGDEEKFSVKDGKTKRISPKKQWINDYVNGMSFLLGRDKKSVRTEIEGKIADARREAKNLYAKVLAGEFNSVTLQQLNDYIDNATNRNRFYRPLSQRLRERALLPLQGYGRANEVDALFSRICESAVPKNGRVSAEGRRKIEKRKEELLEGWAKATGNWHETIADFTDETSAFKSGTDSDVYLSNDGKTVIKASKGKFDSRKFPSDIDQVALFNSVFPHSGYRIAGYGRLNGRFVKFLEQNFVDFSTSTPLTAEERVAYMRRLGFEPRNAGKTVFSNGDLVVSDLQKSNIVKDKDGNVRVIDADVKLHTRDIGGNYTYPDVETDTEVPADAVIPLSERFNENTGDVRYSLKQANERFNNEIEDFKNKSHKGLMHLGAPSPVLKACGVDVDEITLSPSVLHSHLKKHNLTADDLKGLVMSMQRPILVYKHGQHSPNIVVVTELDVKGGKLSASLKLDTNGEVVEVSNVSSIHSKDAMTELNRLYKIGEDEFRNALRWVEKGKVLPWLAPSSYEPSGMQGKKAPFDVAKILNDFVNPKISEENLQDEEKFSIKTYHGSGADFDRFDHSHMGEGEGAQAYGWGTYVTEVEGIGRMYANSVVNADAPFREMEYTGNNLTPREVSMVAPVFNGGERTYDETVQWLQGIDNERSKRALEILLKTTADEWTHPKQGRRNLYTIDIPDDNGSNYLDWNEPATEEQIKDIRKYLAENYRKRKLEDFDASIAEVKDAPNADEVNAWTRKGENIYKTLKELLGSDKEASKALSEIGFTGIKYPADNMRGGREDGAKNYVIFNESDAQIVDHTRFSLKKVNDKFNADLKAYIEEGLQPEDGRFELGLPSNVLQSAGFPNLPISMRVSLLNKKAGMERHPFSPEDLYNIVEAIQKPLAVFEYTKPNMRNLIVDLTRGGKHFLVGITLDYNKGEFEGNSVSGLFPKENHEWIKWIQDGKAIRIDQKDKVLNLIASLRTNPAESERIGLNLNHVAKIVEDFPNPKLPDENLQDAPKFSLRNADSFMQDVSEKGLGGVLGKANVDKLVDDLYMGNEDIRKEINEGIAKAGFDYRKATRNWIDGIVQGKVSPEAWHNVRTAVQKQLRENGINTTLTDNDIAYSLWKEANPGKDVLSQAKDIATQMDLGTARFSIRGGNLNAGQAMDEYNRKSLSKAMDWKEAWQDKMATVEALQNAIANETGTPISDSEDVYHAENRMHGASKNEVEHYEDNYLNPLLKEVANVLAEAKKKKYGLDYNGLMDYLMAKHGIERNSFIALRTMLTEAQEERAKQVTDQLKAKAEQDFQDALNAAKGLQGIDLMNAVKKANQAKRKADRIAEQTGAEEGRKLRDALYDGYKNDADLIQAKQDLDNKKITFRQYEETKRDIMEKHLPGTKQKIQDQGDKAGLSNIMDDDTDFEALAHNFVEDVERNIPTDKLWRKVNAATGKTLEKSYTSGRMTKKSHDYVSGMFDFYVPLRGWDETTADEVYEYVNASRPMFTPAPKKMFGRKSKAEDPIAYIGNMAVSEISIGNKNLMKQYLLRLAQQHPTSVLSVSEVWYENTGTAANPQWVEVSPNITEGMSAADVTTEMERFKNDMEQKRQQGMAKRSKEGLSVGMPILPMQVQEHRVDVMVDGQKYSIFVNGSPKAAQAVNGTNKVNVDFHLGDSFINRANRFISEVLTSKNPAFVPANFARDMIGAHSQIWIKENARYIMDFEKNVLKVVGSPRAGGKLGVTGYMPELIRKWKAGKLDTSHDIERYFGEFMEHGGETGYVNILGVDKYKEDIRKKLDNFSGHYGKNAWNAVWDTVEFYNRAVEDATRFITYMTSREQGRSVDRAIDDAKVISLNFNRSGTGAKGNALLRKTVIFVNPAIQALDNQFKLISQHPARFAGHIATLIMIGMAQSKLNDLLMSLFGGDDDKEDYYAIPEWTRRNNLVLWMPGTRNFLKIPLSQEFRMWHGLGETMQGVIDGRTKSDPATDLLSNMLSLLPVDPTGNGGNPIANVMPTVVKPVYEITENENFLGLPIYRDNQGNEYEPEFQRVSYGTPAWMTKVSEGLNTLTGGDTHEKGWLEKPLADNKYARLLTNPSVWNHLLSGYLGGPYNVISQTAGIATDIKDGEGVKVSDIPVASRFVARPSERETAGRTSDQYRDLVKEAEETRSKYRHYRSDYEQATVNGNEEEAAKAMGKMQEIMRSEDFLRMRTVEAYDRQIQKVRQIVNMYDDKETKRKYGEMLKDMEEQLLRQIEAPEIKK